ncbi:MAG: hypothetical protein RLZZ385_1885 [Pseudomonadota bacterium]|jgi:hypothetical protein
MKPILSLYLPVLLCFLLPWNAEALPVSGLYAHEVAVNSQTDAERSRAFREALSAVVVKVTGDRRWLDNSAVRQALDNAQGFVEEIRYRSETSRVTVPPDPSPDPAAVAGPPAPQLQQQNFVSVSFAPDLVDRLLASAAIPVWDANRPSVLIWMVVQDSDGNRRLLSQDSHPDIVTLMQSFAGQRGVPILFPVLDFEDRRNLSEAQLWALDAEAIARASARYTPDSILAGRLLRTGTSDLVGLWQFQFRDQLQVFDSFETDLARYINAPLDRVTSQLAGHFAVVKSTSGRQKVRLQVSNVSNLGDWSSLVNYLQGLGVVESVITAEVAGDTLQMDLSLLGTPTQLYELITLDRALLPTDPQSAGRGQEGGAALMNYRWTR